MKPKKRSPAVKLTTYVMLKIPNDFLLWVKPERRYPRNFGGMLFFKLIFLIFGLSSLAIFTAHNLQEFIQIIILPNRTIETVCLVIGTLLTTFGLFIRLPSPFFVIPLWKNILLAAQDTYNRAADGWNSLIHILSEDARKRQEIAEFNRRYWQLSQFRRKLFEMETKAKTNILTEKDLEELRFEQTHIATYFWRL